MDQNYQPIQQQPINPSTMPATPLVTEHKKVGPIIAILILVLVLVIAGLYIFASKLNNTPIETLPTQSTATLETVAPVTSSADDPQSLQDDLNTATAGIDSQNF